MKKTLRQRFSTQTLLYTKRGIEALTKYLRTTNIVKRYEENEIWLNVGWGSLNDD
jgi:hypothetical protein